MKEAGQSAPEGPTASGRAGPRLCNSVLQVILGLRRQILGKLFTFLWKDSGSWATGPALSPVFFLSIATPSRPPLDSEVGKCAHEPLTCWPRVWRTRLTARPSGKAAKDRERRAGCAFQWGSVRWVRRSLSPPSH